MDTTKIYSAVDERYGQIARDTRSNTVQSQRVAVSFGYSVDELAAIPDGANLGVSCGNPLAIAGIKEGETVLDLGCGAGFDVFLAARKVGRRGMAIGVDRNKDMLARARSNAVKFSTANVQFIESPITALTLPSESVNCIISNCVINLVPHSDKHLVFSEIFRVLTPGGRAAFSDILAKKPFTEALRQDIGLYVGCISGASLRDEYETWLRKAGFREILILNKDTDLNIYKETISEEPGFTEDHTKALACCRPTVNEPLGVMHQGCCTSGAGNGELQDNVWNSKINIDFNEWAGSFDIYAVKPSV